jgi:hypothetical protein
LEGDKYNVFDGNVLVDNGVSKLWALEGMKD